MRRRLFSIISVDLDTKDQILIIYSAVTKWEYNEAVHQLYIDFKKAYDSLRRDVLYDIFIEFGIPM
jgi:hypothetical protein